MNRDISMDGVDAIDNENSSHEANIDEEAYEKIEFIGNDLSDWSDSCGSSDETSVAVNDVESIQINEYILLKEHFLKREKVEFSGYSK